MLRNYQTQEEIDGQAARVRAKAKANNALIKKLKAENLALKAQIEALKIELDRADFIVQYYANR